MADNTSGTHGAAGGTPVGSVDANDRLAKLAREHKTWGYIIAICMVVLGILFLMSPITTNLAAMVAATIGFILFGIYEIVVYSRTPREYRDKWILANGIVAVIFGVLLIVSTPGEMYMAFAFLLGFMALYGGIMQCAEYSLLRRVRRPGAGWVLTSGILNILMSIFFILTPFAATWAAAYVLGIYLIVGGIALFAEAASGHHGIRV